MSVNVEDILQLELLKSAELVAGKGGLANEVMRVNFTDSPLNPEKPGYELVAKGDLYILSFYADKDSEDHLYELIQFYIQSGSCCCIGIKSYLEKLPEKVLRLADREKFPIIMADGEMPYGQLIKDISELILTEQLDLHSENKINRLLYDNLNTNEQKEIIKYLAPSLPQTFYCLYITYQSLSSLRFKLLKQELAERFHLNFLRYQKGGFLIMNAASSTVLTPGSDSLMGIFERYGEVFYMGISSRLEKTEEPCRCFKEAVSAHEISLLTGSRFAYYEDVSVYTLLLPLKGQHLLHSFVKETLGPLDSYGKRQSIDMIETVRVFFETNGSFKETAIRLNTHENTIRFRISKAKSLLGLNGELYTFIERIALALKAEKLLKD